MRCFPAASMPGIRARAIKTQLPGAKNRRRPFPGAGGMQLYILLLMRSQGFLLALALGYFPRCDLAVAFLDRGWLAH